MISFKRECIAYAIKIYKNKMLEYIFTLPWIKKLKHIYFFNDDELISIYSYVVGLLDDSPELEYFAKKYDLPKGINKLGAFEFLILSKKFNCEIIIIDGGKSITYVDETITSDKKIIIDIHNTILTKHAFSCLKHDQT
jgi:hypothetical protein